MSASANLVLANVCNVSAGTPVLAMSARSTTLYPCLTKLDTSVAL